MSDRAPQLVFYGLALLLVLSGLVARRLPIGQMVKMALGWVAIFAIVVVVFAFRDNFGALWRQLKSEITGSAVAEGGEVRVPIAEDGHYWIDAKVNGREARFLVDSGASVTTISRELARAASVPADGNRVSINTANGLSSAVQASADNLQVGPIERKDFPVDINDNDQTNVLGMNFLSSLSGWRVEGHSLILRP